MQNDKLFPSPTAGRWVVRRKAVVLDAIRNGFLSLEQACERYTLSADELISWEIAYSRHGLNGLRAMRLQAYRRPLVQDVLQDQRAAHAG